MGFRRGELDDDDAAQQVEEEDPGTPEKMVAQIGMGMLAVLPWGRR
jgi:hypothetical protein